MPDTVRDAPRRRSRKKKRGKPSGFLQNPTLFPARKRGIMVFDNLANLQPAASAPAYNTYRANSLYDPDFTGVGTTASGYATMSGVYNKYRVISCQADIVWSNPNPTNAIAFVCANPLNTVGTSYATIMAQKHVWTGPLGNVNGPHLKHSCRFSIASIYGSTAAAVMTEDDFASVVGANPNNAVFLHVGVMNSTTTAFAAPVQLQVRLCFDVEWSLPLQTL